VTGEGSVLTDTAEQIAAAVAERVRALRAARGWSLDELAGRSGVSKGMLVQVEGVRTNPSIGTLCRIADAFGVTVGRLLEPPDPRPVRVTDAERAPVLWRGEKGGLARLLAEGGSVELWEWRLEPGERHRSPAHAAGTRELLHVLAGTVEVTVDGTEHRVRAGQTVEYVADGAHAYANAGRGVARLIMVVSMPVSP